MDAPASLRGAGAPGSALLLLSVLLTAACSRDEITIGQSPLLRFVERKSGRIAIMGADGNIYTMDQAGGAQVAVTEDAVIPDETQGLVRYYQFPAWAPDDSRLAFIGYQGNDQFATTTSVFTTAPDGSNIVQAFSSGQYLPRNLYWSPDGEWLTFLTSTSGSTASALQIVPAAGGEATKLDAGNPFYWSWAPDGRTILVHAGGSGMAYRSRLAFLNVDGVIYEEEHGAAAGRVPGPRMVAGRYAHAGGGTVGRPGRAGGDQPRRIALPGVDPGRRRPRIRLVARRQNRWRTWRATAANRDSRETWRWSIWRLVTPSRPC